MAQYLALEAVAESNDEKKILHAFVRPIAFGSGKTFHLVYFNEFGRNTGHSQSRQLRLQWIYAAYLVGTIAIAEEYSLAFR